MNKTRHAQMRQQQRGITDRHIEILELLGKPMPGKGDSTVIELPSDILQIVEKAKNIRIIMCDAHITTVEHKIKPTKQRMKGKRRRNRRKSSFRGGSSNPQMF